MATIVTLESIKDGIHKVRIKREFDSSSETREFTEKGLEEYLESVKAYCEHKGYEFIYKPLEISRVEAYAGLDETDIKVLDQELELQFTWAKNAGKEMTYHYFLEDKSTIALVVYWDGETVETYRFINKGRLMEAETMKKLTYEDSKKNLELWEKQHTEEREWRRERDCNLMDLGQTTKVLLDLHLKEPKKFCAEFIIQQLLSEYERMGLDREREFSNEGEN